MQYFLNKHDRKKDIDIRRSHNRKSRLIINKNLSFCYYCCFFFFFFFFFFLIAPNSHQHFEDSDIFGADWVILVFP